MPAPVNQYRRLADAVPGPFVSPAERRVWDVLPDTWTSTAEMAGVTGRGLGVTRRHLDNLVEFRCAEFRVAPWTAQAADGVVHHAKGKFYAKTGNFRGPLCTSPDFAIKALRAALLAALDALPTTAQEGT